MKAFAIPQRDGLTVELAEVPMPQINVDEILVRVHAVGVGIHDSYFLPSDAKYPFPIGVEAAGVVEEIGSEVSDHVPGDRVAFVSSMQPKGGTWAQFAAVKSGSLIIPMPAGMDFIEAAAVPVAGNTALRALHVLEPAPARGSLFIAGGSGAIGTLAIQLACERGWRVIASASTPNHEYMRSLGATEVVDYRDPDWTVQVLRWSNGGVDAVIAVQPGTSSDCLKVAKDGGSLITISGDDVPSERGILIQTVPYQTDVTAELTRLMGAIADQEMRVEIEHVYPFDEALTALARVQTRHVRGKLVLRVQ